MQSIETAIASTQKEDRLPCALAHTLARQNGWSPAQVGQRATDLGVKITLCQLGLFGYKAFGQKGAVQAFATVPEEVAAAIRAVAVGGKLPCKGLWKIGERYGLPRVAVGRAAEALGLKVSPCQLGCF